MVEPGKLKEMFDTLDGTVARLRILQTYPRDEFLADFTRTESAKYLLQVAVECCIDVAHHMIAAEGWRAPRDYADAFVVLNEQGILPDDFVSIARQMVRFRNRVVHLYWEVDDALVYQILQTNLGDFDHFREYVFDSFPDIQEDVK